MRRWVGFGEISSSAVALLILLSMVESSQQQIPKLKENSTCLTKEGQQGVCKRLDLCPEGSAAISSGGKPKICGFTDDSLIICCPVDPTKVSAQPLSTSASVEPLQNRSSPDAYAAAAKKAKQMCEEYAKTVILEFESPILVEGASGTERFDTCARVEEPLIVGGENAKAREFPHMALIGYGESNVIWLCGGSLISPRFILSAAHCSRTASLGLAKWAKLGDLDTSTEMDDALPQVLKIEERIVNPKYTRDLLYNDIALFKLEHDVEISEYIRPLCLFSGKIPQNEVIATGWGHTSWGGTASASLMKVKFGLVSTETCDEKYKPSRGKKLPQGIIEESQVCAGDEVGKDTCQGDSGGPLQIPLKEPYCMYGLIGVTSFGKSCGTTYPGVYTRVSHFLPWIVENVWP